MKSSPVARISRLRAWKDSQKAGVMGVSMPTRGMNRLAVLIASITFGAQFVAPRLKRSSGSPASPRARRFSSVASVPLVYRCW